MVSIIIPVYNVKPYLQRCVQSVLHQTYKDIEVIIVDDGSTDGSGELCDKIAGLDQRICVIHQKNQGLSGARNTGIRQAAGEYIAFIDSDDEWLLTDGLEKLIEKAYTTTDLIVFRHVDIWKNNHKTYLKEYDVDNISRLPDAQAVFSHLVLTQQFQMSACFLLVRRTLLLSNDIFFPIGFVSEDIYWSMHLWQHVRKVIVTNLYFYGYYHRGESLSTSESIRTYDSYDKIFTYWKKQCLDGCVNARPIISYLANMWVNRGYVYYLLPKADKPKALAILKRHADLLDNALTPKAKRVGKLARIIGIKNTANFLGLYWRMRKRIIVQEI